MTNYSFVQRFVCSPEKAQGSIQQHHGGSAVAFYAGPGGQTVPYGLPGGQGPRVHAEDRGQADRHRSGQNQFLLLLCGMPMTAFVLLARAGTATATPSRMFVLQRSTR